MLLFVELSGFYDLKIYCFILQKQHTELESK